MLIASTLVKPFAWPIYTMLFGFLVKQLAKKGRTTAEDFAPLGLDLMIGAIMGHCAQLFRTQQKAVGPDQTLSLTADDLSWFLIGLLLSLAVVFLIQKIGWLEVSPNQYQRHTLWGILLPAVIGSTFVYFSWLRYH
jgi:hypothetical protein